MINDQFLVNQENRQHINISRRAMEIVELDMIRFKNDYQLKNKSGFINTIISNYRDNFPLSPTILLKQIKEFDNTKDGLISATVASQIGERLSNLIMRDNISAYSTMFSNEFQFKLKLNKENVEFFETFEDAIFFNSFAPRGAGLSFYIKIILETYSRLKKEDRERIYFLKTYELIEFARENKCYLTLMYKGNKTKGKVKRSYCNHDVLTNYVEIECQISENSYHVFTISLKDLCHSKLKILKERYHEIATAFDKNEDTDNIIECKVRFDSIGLSLYTLEENKLDIIGIPSIDSQYIYTFKAAEQKLFINLFKFGPLAEIIEPLYLRNRFKELYEASAKKYATR